MTSFVSLDPLNNLTNLFQRPIFIQAQRSPTILDVQPPGTQWGDGATPIQNIYETPGHGIWILLASAGSPITNINGILPTAGTINIVANQLIPGIPDGITMTSPSTQGPGNTIGIGVLVDGTTITKNASGQLQVANSSLSVVVTTVGAVVSPLFTIPLGAVPGTYTFEIDVAAYCFAGAAAPGSVGYTLVGAVMTSGAVATLIPGQALDEFEVAALVDADVNINVAANNAVINVTGVAANSLRWSGSIKYIFQG